jgi:hypothetical protein
VVTTSTAALSRTPVAIDMRGTVAHDTASASDLLTALIVVAALGIPLLEAATDYAPFSLTSCVVAALMALYTRAALRAELRERSIADVG